MKSIFKKFTFIFLFAMLFSIPVYANDVIVELDGQPVLFPDQQPIIKDGRTLVPVRGVFEQLGYSISWDDATQTATLSNSDNTVVIKRGESKFTTNGKSHNLDVPAQTINSRMMIPFRAVLESVGYAVDWDNGNKTVMIHSIRSEVFDISMYEYQWFENKLPSKNSTTLELQNNKVYVYLTRLFDGIATINPNLKKQDIIFINDYFSEEKLNATISFEEYGIVLYIHSIENVSYAEDLFGSQLIFRYVLEGDEYTVVTSDTNEMDYYITNTIDYSIKKNTTQPK